MKASEVKPLSSEELVTLKSLFQRWVLSRYPYYDGYAASSDAIQTYLDVKKDAENGKVRTPAVPESAMTEEVEL